MRKSWISIFSGLLILGALAVDPRTVYADDQGRADREDGASGAHKARTLYVWAGDQARVAPDFLAVIDFDEQSEDYGKLIETVPIPPPGNVGNEPHHCHLSTDENILACGTTAHTIASESGPHVGRD